MPRMTDNRMRMNKTMTLDIKIFQSAEANKMKPARFIEWLYDKAQKAEFPDTMPLEEKQAKYVELDRTLRALGAVIEEEKAKATKLAEDKAAFSESDKDKTDKAILAITDCILTPERERSKSPLDLAVIRASMLALGTNGRVKLEPQELVELAALKLDARRKQLEAERHEQEARLKQPTP